MAWTTPAAAVPGTVISAANHNTYIRDNLLYLFSGRPIVTKRLTTGSYNTTSTVFVDIDATNVKLDVTIQSGRMGIALVGSFYQSAGGVNLALDVAVLVNGTALSTGEQNNTLIASGGPRRTISLLWLEQGLTTGTKTIKWQWKVSNDQATLNAVATSPLLLMAWEL